MSNNPSTTPHGNVTGGWVIALTLSPASVANATSAEQTFTFTGARLGDYIAVSKPTTQAGLGIVNARVSAKDVLAIAFINSTAATITPTASEVYTVQVNRPENLNGNVSALVGPF